MLGYILPTGEGRHVLWYPWPRLVWGIFKHLSRTITILSGNKDVDIKDIPLLTKDNIHRPTVQRGMVPFWVFYWAGRLMLWGIIWLAGIDDPLEDVIGGLYLLLGLPMFIAINRGILQDCLQKIVARFSALTYHPKILVINCPRLETLERHINESGINQALNHLDELGFRHLQEFYRRVAWQPRWKVPPPTGAGVINAKTKS